MNTADPILFSVENQIAKIILNRPEVYNSFDLALANRTQEVLQTCKEDADIRAVYITGAGKAFSAGQDIKEITGDNPPALSTILTERFNPIIKRITELDKPVVAAVNGVAAGAGSSLALACDICVASEDAKFIQSFANIGLIPDGGATYIMPRLIGWQKAKALMMLGESITAKEAAGLGMIYQTFKKNSFEKSSWDLALRLAKMPTKALWMIKKALSFSYNCDLERQLAMEAELQSTASRTADFKEGITAFIEKRAPEFKGE
ncbi:MAG: 2-(1,2-epoxy-1,2-dihydrophenyl)acetyl-CoA isomerase PaaG [Saprospiraceae bacterium]